MGGHVRVRVGEWTGLSGHADISMLSHGKQRKQLSSSKKMDTEVKSRQLLTRKSTGKQRLPVRARRRRSFHKTAEEDRGR